MIYLTQTLKDNYKKSIDEQKKKVNMWILIFTGLILLGAGVTFLFRNQDEGLVVLFYILISLVVMLLITLFIVKNTFVSEKPHYEILYPKLIEDINYDENLDMSYMPYPKEKEVIDASQLFTRFSSKTFRAKINYTINSNYKATLYDVYCFTQSNNSQVKHFNGYFIVIERFETIDFQIRTKGKPQTKHIKYNKTVDKKRLQVFIDEKANDTLETQWMEAFNVLIQAYDAKDVWVSAVDQKIYIAVDLKKITRKISILNEKSYIEAKKQLIDVINLSVKFVEKV